jgi:hypothetical protein
MAAVDEFRRMGSGVDGPASNAAAVTPNDSADLTTATRALWVVVEGDVTVDLIGGQTAVTFKNVQGLLPVRVTRVDATGTTATDIVALW